MKRHIRNGARPGDSRVVGLFESAWRHWFAVVSVVAVAAVGGYLLSARQPPVYQASTTLLFPDATGSPVDQTSLPGQDHSRYIATQAAVITSGPVTTAAAGQLHDGTSAEDIAAALTAVPGGSADTLTITASARTGPRAARLADAAAAGYLGVMRDQARAAAATAAVNLQRQSDDLRRRLDILGPRPRTPGDAALAAALQDQLRDVANQQNRLRLAAATYEPLVRVVRPAILPAAPTSPVPLRDAGLAALVALLMSAAAAWALEAHVQRRSDTGRFTRVLGAQCLGWVPAIRTMPARDPATGAPLIAVHWQQLVSAVDASLRELGGGCLLITAPGAAGRPGLAAANLAAAAAADGRFVIVVDADHADHELSTAAGASSSSGLTELAADGGELRHGGRQGAIEGRTAALLAAGRPVANSVAFYRTPGFRATLASIGQQADLVLVVAPPVLDGADASVLADATEAVVLVVPESATEADLAATATALSWSRGTLIGYVLVGSTRVWTWRRPSAVPADEVAEPAAPPLEPLLVVSRRAISSNGGGVHGDRTMASADRDSGTSSVFRGRATVHVAGHSDGTGGPA